MSVIIIIIVIVILIAVIFFFWNRSQPQKVAENSIPQTQQQQHTIEQPTIDMKAFEQKFNEQNDRIDQLYDEIDKCKTYIMYLEEQLINDGKEHLIKDTHVTTTKKTVTNTGLKKKSIL